MRQVSISYNLLLRMFSRIHFLPNLFQLANSNLHFWMLHKIEICFFFLCTPSATVGLTTDGFVY